MLHRTNITHLLLRSRAEYCDERVCVFVCLSYIRNCTSDLHQMFRPWLGPPLHGGVVISYTYTLTTEQDNTLLQIESWIIFETQCIVWLLSLQAWTSGSVAIRF